MTDKYGNVLEIKKITPTNGCPVHYVILWNGLETGEEYLTRREAASELCDLSIS